MMSINGIARDERGASMLEFALILPALATFLLVTIQLGIIFYADAGIRHGLGEAARIATLHPTPSNSQIKSVVTTKSFGVKSGTLSTPTVTSGEKDGQDYVDIAVTYDYVIDPFLLPAVPVKLVRERRVFIQET